MNLLEKYNKLNNSFEKKYIFHIGAEAGFYSEFNNMVYAILYCLKHQYKFILYSREANFKFNKGWEDFFEPFCESNNNLLLHKINTRTVAPKLNRKQKIQYKLFKLLYPNTLLTYQLWPKFFCPAFEKETFTIPELGIDGNLRDSARIIVEMIYNFNSSTKKKIQSIKQILDLPKEYIALNIRRGDKNTEIKYVETELFLNALQMQPHIKNIFIFTDDYNVITELQAKISNDYNFYFLVKENETGYVHSDFIKLNKQEKNMKLLNMFASVEIMSEAKTAYGQFTTNPGFFLGMKMKENSFVSLQKQNWYLFETEEIENELNNNLKEILTQIIRKNQ